MNTPLATRDPVTTATTHALFWMMAANAVGFFLSLLFLFPHLGQLLGEWTYGRMLPLHLNWHLYGWTAMPLIAWVFSHFSQTRDQFKNISYLAIWSWSLTLMIGGAYWLNGQTSGKIFLDWSGVTRYLFPIVMLFIWSVLYVSHLRDKQKPLMRLIGLLALLPVPLGIFIASSPKVYPPVDVSTGGPSGASLVNSTLIVILLLLLLPICLKAVGDLKKLTRNLWFLFGVNAAIGILAETQLETSHTNPLQIAALATLLIWSVVIPYYYKRLRWKHSQSLWRNAMLVWLVILTLNGFLLFLPGILDSIKFTNALVAHTHLAMAGFTTSFVMFLMQQILPEAKADLLNSKKLFWLWQSGTILYILTMTIVGYFEAKDSGYLINSSSDRNLFYSLRCIAGLALLLCSYQWWKRSYFTDSTPSA